MKTTRLQQAAALARSFFVKGKRPGEEFWHIKNTPEPAPEYVSGLAFAAHGKMSCNDWRYEFIVEALDALVGTDNPDGIEPEPDVHDFTLIHWLGSHAYRAIYCNEAAEEWGCLPDGGIMAIIRWGQCNEKEEVLDLVRAFLEKNQDTILGPEDE